MGGDDPRRQQQDPNVIIPDIGAGKYWYVDPRAGVAQRPAQVYDPMADAKSNEAQLKMWGKQPMIKSLVNDEQGHLDVVEALKRLQLLPPDTRPSF